MRSLILAVLGLMIAFTAPALAALTLESAKVQGVVGERPDGLLGAVGAPAPDVSALVASVNKERLERYAGIAAKNGTDVTKVQAVAGQKLIENTPAGQYVQDASGGWVKK